MGQSVAVLGASGYTGAELLRLLRGHPSMGVVALGGERRAGAAVDHVHPHLAGTGSDPLSTVGVAAAADVDVCFSCLPSGTLRGLVDSVAARVVIDLSDDFRADPAWTYGLVELARSALPGARRIANPGCYPTATLLALVPFVRAELIEEPIVVDALSGTSGAGKRIEESYLFSALHGSAGAYGEVDHRHVAEMERGLEDLGGLNLRVSFTPHLVPMARGLLVTCRARLRMPLDDDDVLAVLHEAYDGERFVSVIPSWPTTKAVAGTNRTLVSARVDPRTGFLIASASIDNLGKGAAGQAIQNANVALGNDETAGLELLAAWP